jgi:hypothetical protein
MRHSDGAKDEGRKREHLRYGRKPNFDYGNHRHPRRVRPSLHDVNRRPFDNHADHQSYDQHHEVTTPPRIHEPIASTERHPAGAEDEKDGFCCKNSVTIQHIVAIADSFPHWNVVKIFFATEPLRDIDARNTRGAAALLNQVLRLGQAPIVEVRAINKGAAGGERPRSLPADAGTSAGDQRDFPLEIAKHECACHIRSLRVFFLCGSCRLKLLMQPSKVIPTSSHLISGRTKY